MCDQANDYQGYMSYAGFWRRVAAFFIDVFPIQLGCFFIFYYLLGFDQTLHDYMNGPKDLESRIVFLSERNHIRDAAFTIWIFYCILAEASPLQGTFGKHLLGMRVVDKTGGRPSCWRVIIRNIGKILSVLPLFLGFLWAAWSGTKRGWHDWLSGCYVVKIDRI